MKSAWEQFYHIFWSLWGEVIWKNLPYWNLKSLWTLLTHWLPMTSILFEIVKICSSLSKCNYLRNKKVFLIFFLHLWNLHQIWNIFQKEMIVIANVFSRLQTLKDLVKRLSKDRRFRTSFGNQHVKWFQTLVRSAWEDFYHIFWSLLEKMNLKISRLLNFEILVVFVNTLTANETYPLGHSGNL